MGPVGAVRDHPSTVTTRNTNPKKQTSRLFVGIQSPVFMEPMERSFYTSFAKITVGADHYSPSCRMHGYNVIAGQRVSLAAVWQSTCYKSCWRRSQSAAGISRFLARDGVIEITQHAR